MALTPIKYALVRAFSCQARQRNGFEIRDHNLELELYVLDLCHEPGNHARVSYLNFYNFTNLAHHTNRNNKKT